MGSIKDQVAIIGMGCTRFGERWDKGAEDLVIEAAQEAFEDAGIDKQQIEACYFSTVMSSLIGVSGSIAADALKLKDIPFCTQDDPLLQTFQETHLLDHLPLYLPFLLTSPGADYRRPSEGPLYHRTRSRANDP